MRLIGVDVGGTFTDLVLSDTERDLTVIHKVPTTPADPSGGAGRHPRACAAPRDRARRRRARLSRHDHRHQRRAREPGRADRHDHDQGLPRHHPRRTPPAARALLDHAGGAVAGPSARPAPPSKGRERAASPRRAARCSCRSTRTRCARRRARSRPRASRPSRCAFSSRTSTRAHEERAREIIARGVPGGLRHHLGPRVAAVPRVRALHDGGDERLHRAPGQAVREPAGRGAADVRARRRAAHHGVERRRGHAGHGGREAGAHAAVGPRGGRARRRLDRGALRPPPAHHLRRRRDERGHRPRRRRDLQRGHGARHVDRRLSRSSCP